MLELFTAFALFDNYTKDDEQIQENFSNTDIMITKSIPLSWIVIAILISFAAAYLSFACNQFEQPATRAVYTITAFFFSGFYLIFYLFYHIILGYKCPSRGVNNIIRNIVSKK